MKKILLIIAITFLIFQMVVLATAIDVGPGATNRATSLAGPRTAIDVTNPANETGTITNFEIWSAGNMSSCYVYTCFNVGGNNFTVRDYEAVGAVTAGAKRTFTVDLDVEVGDNIGVQYPDGGLEFGTSGGTGLYYDGDFISMPFTNETFDSYQATFIVSIYGIGETEEEEEVNVIFMGADF